MKPVAEPASGESTENNMSSLTGRMTGRTEGAKNEKSRMRLILSVLTGSYVVIGAVMAVNIPIKITGTIHIPSWQIKNNTDFKVSFGRIASESGWAKLCTTHNRGSRL